MTPEEFSALQLEFEADTRRIVDEGEVLVTVVRRRRKVVEVPRKMGGVWRGRRRHMGDQLARTDFGIYRAVGG